MGEKWHRVMQNLFGDQSEEEEEEVDSEHESNPHPNSYRAVTRLSIMLLQALLSAETSTGLIKEGSTIFTKAFQDYNNEMVQLRAGKSSKSKLTIVKFRTSESVDGWDSSFVRGLTFRMWLLLSMMEEWMPSSNSLSREMLFSLDMFSPDEGTKLKAASQKQIHVCFCRCQRTACKISV
ncbi:uncharacterized protein LOC126628337 isoform X3 [Malus sylvestris]|uniref:uncharacterized protein LOC126628337 isoform X3 n=1 Tax=Malus sylvestris TaxID=3752 RepID=UPI0021ACC575|nr:uncharacterized protein LOC126628337 isoform X3 [Malus sylvestris]XP_050153940.1 uncharacterized protein LOC126628337 isoform X3 [Malus sylvestris]